MESGRPNDGSAIYDDSFPEALDENLQNIKASNAVKIRKSIPTLFSIVQSATKLIQTRRQN